MKLSTRIAIGLSITIGPLVGFMFGVYSGQHSAFSQVRTQMMVDLDVAREKGSKQMCELLKARYYYFSNRSGLRFRSQEGDYGPVDTNLIPGFSAGKGPTGFKEEYEDYLRSLPSSK